MSSITYIENIHIIDNHQIYYKYHKNGTPTVIFEAGLGDSSESWAYIQDKISQVTSTFSYDRAGIGKSEVTSTPRTGLDLVEDLLVLVSEISIEPPFVLVGHSFGTIVSRLFASLNSDKVAGMILIDAAPENKEIFFQKVLSESDRIKMKDYLETPDFNSEKIDKVKTYKQVTKLQKQFEFPLLIFIRGLPKCYGEDWPDDKFLKIEQVLQLNLKNLSKINKSIIAKNSGHYIYKDEPELVIKEIMHMINRVSY